MFYDRHHTSIDTTHRLTLHIDFASPLNSSFYLVGVDRFSKWLEICKCKGPSSLTTIIFSHELFATCGISDATVSDSGMQKLPFEFKKFCKMSHVEHIIKAPYLTEKQNALLMRQREH